MKDLAIMYHYVQSPRLKGIVPLEPTDFELQLDWVTKHYEVISPDDLGKSRREKPFCILTFDDATKDQYEVAYPILKKKGIPAYFTVMSGPLVERRVPVFHLIHTVLSFFSDEEIWVELSSKYELDAVPHLSDIYSYETVPCRRYNKYALNFFLSENESRNFLESKALSVFHSFENFIDKYYINESEFIKMRQEGMTLGVHATHHKAFNGDAMDFFMSEIKPCSQFIHERLGFQPKWYTPAFGGGIEAERMMRELEPLLKEHGFKGAFSTQPALNDGLNSFWLHRYDCMALPPRGEKMWK